MRKNKIIQNAMIIGVAFLGGFLISNQFKKEEAIESNEICEIAKSAKLTPKQLLDAIDTYHIDADQHGTVMCDTVCCNTFSMCGLSNDFLVGSMANYAKHVWRKTSKFEVSIASSEDFYDERNKLDARMVHFNFNRLQQYLCYLKRKAFLSGKEVAYVKAVYIQYQDVGPEGKHSNFDVNEKMIDQTLPSQNTPAIVQDLKGIHSLALVPFVRDTTAGSPIVFWSDSNVVYSPDISDCYSKPSLNHGMACPPPDCYGPDKELLNKADERLETIDDLTTWY